MYCDNGVMQGRDLKGQEHKSFFEIDDIFLIACVSQGRRELAVLQFPTLLPVRVQNENFTFGSNPVFVSGTKFPIGLRPAKFGPIGENSAVLSNILRSPYHFVSHNQLQRPRHPFGRIFPLDRKKKKKKIRANTMPQCSELLTIHPDWSASLNEAQAGTRYLLLRKPKVDACQGFVQLPGFADKEGPLRGKPLLSPCRVSSAATQKQGTQKDKENVETAAPEPTAGAGGGL